MIIKIAFRFFIYSWLSFWIILRSDLFLDFVFAHPYAYFILILGLSILLAIKKYDSNFLFCVVKKKTHLLLLYFILSALWIQIGLEWILNMNTINFESFLLYEPILITMGFPVSIIVHLAKPLFHIDDIRLSAIFLWSLYFIAAMMEYAFIMKKIEKINKERKRGMDVAS
jgi:hypothetical protein